MPRLTAKSKLAVAAVSAAVLSIGVTPPMALGMSFPQYAAACAANGGRAVVQHGVYACLFDQPAAPTPTPDPQELAAQRVAPQFRALIAKLSDHTSIGGLLSPGWETIPTSTPTELLSAMQRLYDGLYSTYLSDQREAAVYRQDIWYRDSLKGQLAPIEPQVAATKSDIARLHRELQAAQNSVALYKRVNSQLESASNSLEQTTARLQDETIGWIRATLPDSGMNVQAWGRWKPTFSASQPGPGELSVASVIVPVGAQASERPVPPVAAQAIPAAQPVAKPPLPADIDDRMTAVKQMADVAQAERIMSQTANNGGLRKVISEIDQVQAALDQDRALQTNGDIIDHNLKVQLSEANNRLEQLKADDDLLARRHAAAVVTRWIWESAKDETVDVIKTDVTRFVLEMGTGKAAFSIDNAEVAEAIKTGRSNIFGLTDRILEVKKLVDVVDSVHDLANHTMEYVSATARYAAAATPEQWAAADVLAHRGLDKDVEAIQERSLTAAGLREPFKTVYFRIVGQPEAEQ